MNIVLKNDEGKTASLTKEQLEIVEPIMLDLMNQKLKPKAAQAQIVAKLESEGKPLVFK